MDDGLLQIFTTGGTIDKVYFDARSDYEVGAPEIGRILESVGVTVPYAIETLMRKDSIDLTDDDRTAILEAVRGADATRVLITHGTDTIVETGRVLLQLTNKTVVLVGSLSPSRFKGSDAEFNIGFALAAASTLPAGVYVAMNGRIFDVRRVTKNREQNRFEAT